jgi:hypothetical protein
MTIGVNIGSFFSKPEPIKQKETIVTISEPQKEEKKIEKPLKDEKPKRVASQKNSEIDEEIKKLLKRAEKLLQDSKDSEALLIYDEILKMIGNSSDPELLEHFASVWIFKAFIYQIYPNNDREAALEAYDMVIEKFEQRSEPKLIKLYISSKLQQARLLSPDEKLEVYDELIKKFKNFNDPSIQEEMESLLISKSFDLMGTNDEEAMQILDDVIEKYQNKDENIAIPENIRFSILNNMELAIITNNDNEKYVDLAKKFMSNSPDTKPLIDMLSIIKNAQDLNQDEALAQWKEEHAEYRFPDWSFQELERWAYKMEDAETKARVTQYINAFVNQKYNIPEEHSKEPSSRDIENTQQNDREYREIYDDPYQPKTEEGHPLSPSETDINEENSNELEETIEEENLYEDENLEEPTLYEEDPYRKEIYEATGEYPDPYEQ